MDKQKGFTLIEILAVLMLIGIIVVAIGGFSTKNKNRWDLRGTSRIITASYYELKQRASRENLPCRISFTRNSYSTWSCNEDAGGVRSWVKIRDIPLGTSNMIYVYEGAGYPDIAIDSRGMIFKTDDTTPISLTLSGMQTIELRSPLNYGGSSGDKFLITLYPIGGIDVQSILSQSF
jgi:prepilin-type N-terminal cleavage/methylation domain-containing protein